jgi:hypothetical protein
MGGLTANFTLVSDTVVTLGFIGNATHHAAADSIDNLTVTFGDGAFTTGAATNYSSLGIHFFQVVVPAPIHRWTFNDGTATDSVGTAHGTLYGSATIAAGRLHLTGSNPNNRMETGSFGHTLAEKTLVAWCTLENSENDSKGGPLSVQSGSVFDAIVYGERVHKQWMNGSDWWNRTPLNNGGAAETLAEPDAIMMAIVYASDNGIKIYRNGTSYAAIAQGSLGSFGTDAVALIGPRHGASGTFYGYFNGYIDEARIYNTALNSSQIAVLAAEGPVPVPVRGTVISIR